MNSPISLGSSHCNEKKMYHNNILIHDRQCQMYWCMIIDIGNEFPTFSDQVTVARKRCIISHCMLISYILILVTLNKDMIFICNFSLVPYCGTPFFFMLFQCYLYKLVWYLPIDLREIKIIVIKYSSSTNISRGFTSSL